MIFLIVIVLAVALAALFLDWSWLRKWLDRRSAAAPALPRPQKPKIVLRKEDRARGFDFDPTEEALPAEPMAVEPERPQSTDPEIEEWLSKADVHFRKAEMKAAEDLYLKAAAKDPRCSKAYSRLGVIYLEHGDNWDDAEAAFRQALKTDPENGFILNNLGLVLYHQDKYADAVRHFEQAVRLDELNAARHANLGMAYMAMRQYAKAESSFKKALKLSPGEMEYKDLLAEAIEKKKAHKTMIRR